VNVAVTPAPVRRSVIVRASPAHAFAVFTGRMTRWWRPDHHIGTSPLKEVVLEPRVGGRWYEIGEDGSTCQWGTVLAWEPPARLLLAWQLDADWKYDPHFVTELEVRFLPEGDGTRVELEHRNLERFGDKAEAIRKSLGSPDGWTGALELFAAEAGRAG
jgi:uncharacterized protein YndB with AHSA1/START domain